MNVSMHYMTLWCELQINANHYYDYGLVLSTHIIMDTGTSSDTPPRLHELIQCWYCLLQASCTCLHAYEAVDILACMMYIIQQPIRMQCREVIDCMAFHIMEGTYPSATALLEFQRQQREMDIDADQYCLDHDIKRPFLQTDALMREASDGTSFCAICQHTIARMAHVIKLPCGHCFHEQSQHCLGHGTSILTWFTSHRTCPVCKAVVTI